MKWRLINIVCYWPFTNTCHSRLSEWHFRIGSVCMQLCDKKTMGQQQSMYTRTGIFLFYFIQCLVVERGIFPIKTAFFIQIIIDNFYDYFSPIAFGLFVWFLCCLIILYFCKNISRFFFYLFIHTTLLLLIFCFWLLFWLKCLGKKQRIEQREKSINDWLFVSCYIDGLFVLAKQHCRILCCILAACVCVYMVYGYFCRCSFVCCMRARARGCVYVCFWENIWVWVWVWLCLQVHLSCYDSLLLFLLPYTYSSVLFASSSSVYLTVI